MPIKKHNSVRSCEKEPINLSQGFNQPAESHVEVKHRQRPGPPLATTNARCQSPCDPWAREGSSKGARPDIVS